MLLLWNEKKFYEGSVALAGMWYKTATLFDEFILNSNEVFENQLYTNLKLR